MTLRQSATRLSLYLARQVDLPNERVEPLRFGLEIIIGSLIKGLLIFVLAWTLNLVTEVATALFVGSTFRLLAGGAHSTGYGQRRQFKALSILYLALWLGGAGYLAGHGYASLALAGLLALLAQRFSLTPVGYRLIEQYDSLLTRKQSGKEVTADVGQI
jgi:accessory gene regulator protein AgrB